MEQNYNDIVVKINGKYLQFVRDHNEGVTNGLLIDDINKATHFTHKRIMQLIDSNYFGRNFGTTKISLLFY